MMGKILGALLAIGLVLTIVAIYPLVTSTESGKAPSGQAAGEGATTYNEAAASGSFLPPEGRQPVPALVFLDAEGREVPLSEFRGRVVLLNLWATWCGPCVREMPSLDALQVRLGGPDFAVVALSQDRGGAEVVRKFYEDYDLANLDVWLDKANAAGRALKTRGLPTTVLIDAQGREVGRVEGAEEWDAPEMVERIEAVIAGG